MRKALIALLTLPALLLAGCVGVPMAGPVEPGGIVEGESDAEFDFLPSGPTDGATQEEILAGFFAATTASQDNYRIARSYLADDIASVWNPYQSTLVRSREGVVERIDDNELGYTASIVAEVDSVGRYRASTDETAQTLPPFRFTQEDGEWRIAELGDGILISQQAFPSAFSQHTLYFYDPTFTNLVPDLRWFPTRSAVPTRIVRALLEGPSSWLSQGATVSAIPEGTQLVGAPVPVTDGQAQVDLSSEVLALSDQERQRLRAQLQASLRSVSNVAGVQLTVDQSTVAIPDSAVVPEVNPQVDARLLLMTEEQQFGFSAGTLTLEPIGSLSRIVVELEASAVTLGPTRTAAAALAPDGVWFVRSAELQPVLVDSRPDLIAPSLDGFQRIWTAASSGEGGITAISLAGEITPVEAALPEGARIVSLDISRDDARILLFLDGDSGPRLVVAAIIRDEPSGTPIRLGDFVDIPIEGAAAGSEAVSAAWVDEVRVASVVRLSDEATQVDVHELGGRSTSRGRPPGAVQIVGGNGGIDGLRVLTEAGQVFEPRGSGWQSTGQRASFLATQQ